MRHSRNCSGLDFNTPQDIRDNGLEGSCAHYTVHVRFYAPEYNLTVILLIGQVLVDIT